MAFGVLNRSSQMFAAASSSRHRQGLVLLVQPGEKCYVSPVAVMGMCACLSHRASLGTRLVCWGLLALATALVTQQRTHLLPRHVSSQPSWRRLRRSRASQV